ncbi:MAG TPA: glycosyltransferase family 39 protein [Anaerolineales bacterium]|nr:glycosyltransferase family 39 protein [Anaerolineales bacterium]
MSRLPLPQARLRFCLASSIILAFAFWMRTHNLYGIPIFSFADEGDHIVWAQRFSVGDPTYPLLMDGKFLFGIILAQFRLLGPAPLWLARCAVALISAVSCGACIAIGRQLHSPGAGLLAGLIYAVLPQAVFFERQVFADPVTSAFGSLVVVFTLRIAHNKQLVTVTCLSLALAAAALTKLSGLLYVVIPILAVVALPARRIARAAMALRCMVAVILAAAISGAFLISLTSQLGQSEQSLLNQQIGFVGCPAIICQGNPVAQMDNLWGFAGGAVESIPLLYGWPVIGLALLAWPLSVNRDRNKVSFLTLGVLAMLIAFAFTARGYVPPRYLSFLVTPIAVLAAVSILAIVRRTKTRGPLRTGFMIAILWLITLQPISNTITLIFAFGQAQLPSQEQPAYQNKAIGIGLRDATFHILESDVNVSSPPVVLVADIYIHLVGAYLDRTRIDVRNIGEAYPADLGRWLLEGQTIYLLTPLSGSSNVSHLITEEIGRYPRAGVPTLLLRRVTGANSAIQSEIYRAFFIRPESLTEDFRQLVDSLPLTGSTALLVYPPNQIEALAPLVSASRPNVTLFPIGASWPLDELTIENELSRAAVEHTDLRMLFVQETNGDRRRLIETWLNTHLYRIDEQWFGPVRLINLAGPDEAAQTVTAKARFGDGIQLESVEILDSVPQPGGLIRLRLQWLALASIPQQFKIFTHLFSGDSIIAQHDGQPVGELRPTQTWLAGETIVDQFAIRLPINVAPGIYQLRIGMYDIESQARLPVLLPDDTHSEFFIGGNIEIK